MTGVAIDRWMKRLHSRYVAGRRIRFLDEGNGPAIVLLHGIPTHSYLWRDVVCNLQTEFRVLAPDLPGFGFSDRQGPNGLSPKSLASTVDALLDNLGIEEYGLVGHDYGALVASDLLRNNPRQITSLTIANTNLWRSDWLGSSGVNPLRLLAVPFVGELALAVARPFMLKQAFGLYVSDRTRLTPEIMGMYWYPFTRGFKKTLLQLYRSVHLTESDFACWRQALRAYDGPSQVVWGLHDPTFTEPTGRSIARLMQHGTFIGLEHSNHFVPEDRPRSLSRLVANLAR